MRETEYIAWDKKYKKMVGASGRLQDLFSLRSDGYPSNSNYILLQYTGLRDKNGEKIFEGYLCRDSTGVSLVAWNDKFASFCLRRDGWLSDHWFGEAVDPEDVEVIGNVYENPELLKED